MKRLATASILITTALWVLGCGGLSTDSFGDMVPVDGAPTEPDADEPDAADEPEGADEPEDADAPEDEAGDEGEADEPPDAEDGAGGPEEGDGDAAAPVPAPEAAPAPEGADVVVKGDGKVVLVGGGGRYPVPGKVPTGTYEIEVSFNGAAAVKSGKVTVGATGATVQCKASMGLCRSK
jgi:hypothetical protein